MSTLEKNDHTPDPCTSDAYCTCWDCLDEVEAERTRNGSKPEWFGIPPKLEVLEKGAVS